MPRTVTVIPATRNPLTGVPTAGLHKRRVAAYARVSTDSEEQLTSYEAQVDYYTKLINNNPEWDFVKVYTDEGITGVMLKHRDGFNEMIQDALDGKIDLIVTKSVSRFARNTVDSLMTVRKLKEKGVEIFFQKENIYTLDSKGELLITIMSSLAQEESRSISENVTWGHRKRFADGKVNLPYKQFLGYEKGPDDLPKIVEEQAALVRRIYSMFMGGKTTYMIANQLTKEGVPTPAGKAKWQASTIESILTNEKYKGAALLQKGFTVDFLTKKKKVNQGEVPQYYIEHSHDAIIDPLEFHLVQNEIARRKELGRRYSGSSVFSCRIICADCGRFYGSKVWHSNSKYRSVIWQCNDKFLGDQKCTTPHFTEDELKERFLKAYNTLIADREMLLEDCRLMQQFLTNCEEINEEINSLRAEIEVVAELTRKAIAENSSTAISQDEYLARYNALVERYEKANTRLETLEAKKAVREAKADTIGAFMFELRERDEALTEFDDRLWLATIDSVTAHSDGRLVFKFQNGTEVTA